MAEFTPMPEAKNPGSYVGLSEGIRSSPNTALGSLFEGLAGVLDSGVKEADRNIKANIQQDIFDEVDSVQAEFGIPEATDLQADAEEDSFRAAPSGVQRSMRQLESLQAAYAQGKLKESHYWARMNSMVRQLRGKYPGYRAEIDQMVSSVTGAKPANALRSALMSEWEAEASKVSSMDKVVDWAMKQGHLPADYFQRQSSQNPYTETELMNHVAGRTRDEQDTNAKKSALALAASNGEAIQKDTEKVFRSEANRFVNNLLTDASSAAGANYKALTERIRQAQDAAAGGQPFSAEELNQMRTQMGQLRADVELALHQTSTTPWDADPTHSYATQLSPEQIKAVVDEAMRPIMILENALTSENPWGVLKATASWLDARKNDLSREFIENVPLAEEMMAIEGVLGSAGLGQYLSLNPSLQSSLDEALISYQSLRAARSKTNGASVGDAFEEGVKKERPKAYYDGLIQTWKNKVDAFAKGEMTPDVFENNVNFMFGPGAERALSVLDDASKFEYFKKIADPTVSKQMINHKRQGGEEAYGTYQRFVLTTFEALFRQKVQSIQDLVLDQNMFDVSYDSVNSRFDVTMKIGLGLGNMAAPISQREANKLNEAIQVIKPIIAEGKGDANREVLASLARMGFDPEATPPESFGGRLIRAIVKSLRENVSVSGDKGLLTPIGEL